MPLTTEGLYDQVHATLTNVDQLHLLHFYDQLDPAAQSNLLHQIDAMDWPFIDRLVQKYVRQASAFELPRTIEPAPYHPAPSLANSATDSTENRQARALGESLLADGKVAAFTVAGGQGTRLGWSGPKGTYPATPIGHHSLFQLFAESILKSQQKYGRAIPWAIMTSPINHQATVDFFQQHQHFGLDRELIYFFSQNTLPSFAMDGKALLTAPGQLAVNPDGHGGSLRALHTSGVLDRFSQQGVEQISYFQVDNPLVRCLDPLFIGLHAQSDSEMSSKMVTKTEALERVGNFVIGDGQLQVIEYSDLPDDIAQSTHADGTIKFNAGSIAIHLMRVDFVKRLNQSNDFALPPHRAIKKMPYIDLTTGQQVTPDAPNAVKLELFVFDALPLCQKSLILEVHRSEAFGPIKNAEGADSPQTSQWLQSQRAARWLSQAGVSIPMNADQTFNATIELSPLTAIEPADLLDRTDLPATIEPGQQIIL